MRENKPRFDICERNVGDLASTKRKPKRAYPLYHLLLDAVMTGAITDPTWEDPYV